MLRKKKGQSSLEYIVVLTAIIAAVILGVMLLAGKNTDTGLGKLINRTMGKVQSATSRLPGATTPQ